MGRAILRRAVSLPATLLGVLLLVFVLVRLVPGGPAEAMLGSNATQEQIAEANRQLGLDRPLPVQLGLYLQRVAGGDLGRSIRTGTPVVGLFLERAGPTAQIIGISMVLTITLSLALGLAAAIYAGSRFDRAVQTVTPLLVSLPNFWLALLLALAFAVALPILPLYGLPALAENPLESLRSSILPAIALGGFYSGLLIRGVRASMGDVLDQPYLRTARAFGLSRAKIYFGYALKDALIPVVTLIGLQVRYSIGAVAVIEPIFAIPGLGRLLVDGILQRDYPVIQGTLILTALVLVLANWLVDLLYVVLDPRTRT